MVGKGIISCGGGVGEVELREFRVDDLDDFYEWGSDDEVTMMMTWETFRCKEDAREFLVETVMPHPWFKAICFDRKPVGHVVLKQGLGIHSCRAEIGYAISRKYWNMGFATQAVICALKMAFQQLVGLRRIEALVLTDNTASARVLHKSGFVLDCVLHNYVYLKGRVRDCSLFSYVPSPLTDIENMCVYH